MRRYAPPYSMVLSVFLLASCGAEVANGMGASTGMGQTTGDPRVQAILDAAGDASAGEQLYLSECESCHLEDGTGRANAGAGKDLTGWLVRNPDAAAIDAILYGRAGMLAYGSYLSDQEIADLIAHLRASFAP